MKSIIVKTFTLVLVFGFSFTAYAGTRIQEVWTCSVNKGKTIDDVKAANHKWVAYVNKAVKGGDIKSYVATSIIGEQEYFVYVDSFPNMDSWTGKKTAMEAPAGKTLEAELGEVASCKSNSLYEVEES